MRKFKVFLLLVVVALLPTIVYADVKDSKALTRFLSMSGFKLVETNDMKSLYEIVVESLDGRKNIIYMTKDTRYLIFGGLMDENGQNLTKNRLDELNKVDFSKIPLGDAIKIKKGNGNKKLVMVTDVDCPFCRRANEWLKTQDNYTLYVFLFPMDQLHPNARSKSVKILCSEDKAQALDNAKTDKPLAAQECPDGEQMLAKHVLISQVLGIAGTPLFVTEEGKKIEGFNQFEIENYLRR